MTFVVVCPQCGQKYNLPEELAGKQVGCPQCHADFSAQASADSVPQLSNLGTTDFAAMQSPAHSHPGGHYLPSGAWVAGANVRTTATVNTGPSDTRFRLIGAGLVGLGVFLAGMTFLMHVYANEIYLLPVVLIPMCLILGVTALIFPDITRSMGIFGKHLPWHYRAIGWGLMTVSLILGVILLVLVFSLGGYRPG
jgi:hypothetical protein